MDIIMHIFLETGFAALTWQATTMVMISFVLFYLGVVKGYEPLLLLPIGFGIFLGNLPLTGLTSQGGFLWYLDQGVKLGIYPPLIFLGLGAMTDFGPLLANPKLFLLGAAAQSGIFLTLWGALLLGFTPLQAASIGIIGGANGPAAIYIAALFSPELLAPIIISAYSYMALVPVIQPFLMRLTTTREQRSVVMEDGRRVTRAEKLVFPIAVTLFSLLVIPQGAALIGMLMMGNFFKESNAVERLTQTAKTTLVDIVTIFLGVSIGASAVGEVFLTGQTLTIMFLGLASFILATFFGLLAGVCLYHLTKGKFNPLLGSAGVAAVPMAARVAQKIAREENDNNFILMDAMGANVAGLIGSTVAASILILLVI